MPSYLTSFFFFLQDVYNAAHLIEMICQHTIQIGEWEDKLAAMKSVAAKKVKSNAIIMKSLWKRVNPLHKEVDKIGEVYERAHYL